MPMAFLGMHSNLSLVHSKVVSLMAVKLPASYNCGLKRIMLTRSQL